MVLCQVLNVDGGMPCAFASKSEQKINLVDKVSYESNDQGRNNINISNHLLFYYGVRYHDHVIEIPQKTR